jgi:hypothetical protein
VTFTGVRPGKPPQVILLEGTVVTMNGARDVLPQGRVLVRDGLINLHDHPLSTVVTRVFQEQLLFAYKPRKLYYIGYPASRFPNHAVFGSISEKLTGVSDGFITTRIDGSGFLQQTRDAIACHTTPRGGFSSNSEWQQAWIDNVITTLGGRAFLRLVFPVGGSSEADIWKGL